jgi:hypothetical protein
MKYNLMSISLLLLLLAGCGPSAEQQSTMTASSMTSTAAAWTPTPSATATATFTQTPTPTETATATLTATPTKIPTKTATATQTPDPNRYYAPDDTFSLIPPEGWEPHPADMEYPVLLGPQLGGYSLNLMFIQQESTFMMAFYAAMIQDSLTERAPGITQISEDFLVSDDGKDYFRWEITNLLEGIAYHQILYFFESGDWKLVITYTRLEDQGEEYDMQVDDSMSSVRFSR